MSDTNSEHLNDRARQLVERLANGCDTRQLGSVSFSVYDTAWVSMISKDNEWLFPECFRCILDIQSADGGWRTGDSLDDDLLTTLACLIAMVMHVKAQGSDGCFDLPDLDHRISKAKSYLEANLRTWNMNATLNIAFEFVFPTLLSILENEQIFFSFPERKALEEVRALKMEKFDEEIFYTCQNGFLHSLEGLVGRIDFDRISHLKILGSMMAAPASTAAYLIYSSTWDNEAEQYIRDVVTEGPGKGNGEVPTVHPIPVFECSWVLTTLLEAGFEIPQLGDNNVEKVASYLQDLYQKQNGLFGFAPLVLADPDDTGKALHALNLMGRQVRPNQMIDKFRTSDGYFRTYPGERGVSLSTNCNALRAMLHSPNVENYTAEIVSSANFLCGLWWRGEFGDKWNASRQYGRMLLAQALTHLLHLWDIGQLDQIPDLLMRERIPVVLAQILNQTLFAQTTNGGWDSESSFETTAYGILTLKTVSSLPWHQSLYEIIMSAINSGQLQLDRFKSAWSRSIHVWIGKVMYNSPTLSEAYCLAAMNASAQPSHKWSHKLVNTVDIPGKMVTELANFFSTLEELQSEPIWKLKASAVEACLFLPQLRSTRLDIVPRQHEVKEEYSAVVACTWISLKNKYDLDIGADLLWDMMVFSVWHYHSDEYMETAVARLSEADLGQTKTIIRDCCASDVSDELQSREQHPRSSINTDSSNGSLNDGPETGREETIIEEANKKYAVSSLTNFRAVIRRYVHAMLAYPRVLNASPADRSNYRSSVCNYLLAQIQQVKDNLRFSTHTLWSASMTSVIARPRTSFYTWIYSTGAHSTSCHIAFAFVTCLVSAASALSPNKQQGSAEDCFGSVQQKYLAEDLSTHIAVMTRLYNDFGSATRDRLEGNINSINFPEFHKHTNDTFSAVNEDTKSTNEVELKKQLLQCAKRERKCVDNALAKLLSEMEENAEDGEVRRQRQKANAVRLYVGAAKLYGDIYLARDLSKRAK